MPNHIRNCIRLEFHSAKIMEVPFRIYISFTHENHEFIEAYAHGIDCGMKHIGIRYYVHICGYVCLAGPTLWCLYRFFLTNANAFVWNCIIASLSSLKHEFIDTQFTASYRLIFPMRRHLHHCTAPLRNLKCELMCNSIQDNVNVNNAFASLHLLPV